MRTLACPRCKSEFVRRSRRKTPGERLASAARFYPFRCQICQHRFLAFRPGERYVAVLEPDRREFERMPVEAWSALWTGARGGAARVIDVSAGGCAIETDAALREGDVVRLQVTPAGADRPIAVEQAMVRSARPGRVGVQFIRVQEDDEGRLRQYLYEVFVSRLR
jgi:PilZ domain-containing protein